MTDKKKPVVQDDSRDKKGRFVKGMTGNVDCTDFTVCSLSYKDGSCTVSCASGTASCS